MSKTVFDISALRRLYNQDPAIKAILDYAAGRKNNSAEVTVDRLETILAKEVRGRQPIVDALKALEEIGLGTFMVGRRGGVSRLEWKVPMIEAARAARGDDVEVPLLDPADELFSETRLEARAIDAMHHTYNLRSDFLAEFDLPRDLTAREAFRLAEYIKTLPFDAN